MLTLVRTVYTYTMSCIVGRAGSVQLHKFVSSSRLTNGKQGYGLHSHGHWLALLSDRDNNIELSIYISTLILEYFGGSIET